MIKILDFCGFIFKDICYQPLSSICVIVLKNFEDLIFVDDKLPAKPTKIMSLKNLYVYGIRQ